VRVFIATQLNSTRCRVELSCVAINGPLVNEDIRDTDDEDDEGEQPSTAAGTAAAADYDCTSQQSDNRL